MKIRSHFFFHFFSQAGAPSSNSYATAMIAGAVSAVFVILILVAVVIFLVFWRRYAQFIYCQNLITWLNIEFFLCVYYGCNADFNISILMQLHLNDFWILYLKKMNEVDCEVSILKISLVIDMIFAVHSLSKTSNLCFCNFHKLNGDYFFPSL